MSVCGRNGLDRNGVYFRGDENLALLFEMSRNKLVDIGSRIQVYLNSTCLLVWEDQEP